MQADTEASKALNKTKEDLRQTQSQLQSIQGDLSAARDDYNEYVRHTSEAGLDFHRDANVTVKYYASDGCIYVLRSARGAWFRICRGRRNRHCCRPAVWMAACAARLVTSIQPG